VLALATLEHLNTALGWLNERGRWNYQLQVQLSLLGSGGSTDPLCSPQSVTILTATRQSKLAKEREHDMSNAEDAVCARSCVPLEPSESLCVYKVVRTGIYSSVNNPVKQK